MANYRGPGPKKSKKATRYVDPMAPLDSNNLPEEPTYSSILPNLIQQAPPSSNPIDGNTINNNLIGDTGSETGVGNQYEPTSYDNSRTYAEDIPNLDDIRSGNQGVLSSLGNSAAKFVGKTLLNTVGGIVGTAYGAGDAIVNGDVKKLWDNSFLDKVDAVDQGLENIFKVYKSSNYENQNFLQRMFLHPLQFTDDTTSALSFTAGAILTELLTAGVASESILPRALSYMKLLDRGVEAGEATARLANASKLVQGISDGGVLLKKLATGASYESIIESRQSTMKLRDSMYQDWLKSNPGKDISEMPEGIKDDIDNRLSKAGMFSYLSNLALVGGTNLVQFPKLFGLGARSSARIAEDAVRRNAETGLFEVAAGTTSRLGRIAHALENPFHEGVVEEGLQNVIAGTSQQYWNRKNDPEHKSDTDSFLNVFAHNLAQTYTSKEGWNDIGMGMIIGALGAPSKGVLAALGKNNALGKYGYDAITNDKGEVVDYKRKLIWEGGLFGHDPEKAHEAAQVQEVVDRLNQNTNLFDSMRRNYNTAVTNQSLEATKQAAINSNNLFEFNNAKDDQIHNYISSRLEAGLNEDLESTVSDMKKMSPQDFYTEFRGEEEANKLNSQDKLKFQQETIKSFEDRVANTQTAIDIADQNYKGNNSDLREELIHAIATSKNVDTRENEINKRLATLTGGLISNMNGIRYSTSLRKDDTTTINETISNLEESASTLSKEDAEPINKLVQELKKSNYKNLTPNEFDLVNNFAQTNPTDFYLNKDEVLGLLDDSRKLRSRRQNYISLYNSLFTREGQQAFEKAQAKLEEDTAKSIKDQQDREEQATEEANKQANNTATVNKAKNIKKTQAKTQAKANVVDEDDELNLQPAERAEPEVTKPVKKKVAKKVATPTESNLPNVNITEDDLNDIPIDNSGDNISTDTSLSAEEETIVDIEDHKKESKKDKTPVVKNATEEAFDTENINYVNDDVKRTIGNTIAYKGIDSLTSITRTGDTAKTSTSDLFDSNGNVVVNQYVDTKLFSQNYYTPGTTVGITVPSFEQMEARGLQNYTRDDFNRYSNNVDEFPIAITNNSNEIIGYLPTQSGIRNLVDDEFKEQALKDNKTLREKIFSNKNLNHNITITSKSPGMLIANRVSNQQSLFKALGDSNRLADNTYIGIGQSGLIQLKTGISGRFKAGDIINYDNIQDGVVYSIVPSSQKDKFIAYPMKVSKIGESNANLITEAIKIFAKGENTNTQEKQSLGNITEYNFSNFKDVTKFINNILYTNSGTNATEQNIFKISKGNLILSKEDENKSFSLQDIANSPEVRQQVANILADRYHTVDLTNLNNSSNFISYSLQNGVIQQDTNKNYQSYLNDNNVITSNLKGIKIEGNEYAFTAQSVIGLSNSLTNSTDRIEDSKQVQETSINQEVEKAGPASLQYQDIKVGDRVQQGTKIGNITAKEGGKVTITFDTGGKFEVNPNFSEIYKVEEAVKPTTQARITNKTLFDPTKNKPKPLEDINPEFIEQNNIKSAEDLKRKCL